MNIQKVLIASLLTLLTLGAANVSHAEPLSEQWSWKMDFSGFAESQISIYRKGKKATSYLIGCDLSDYLAKENNESPSSVDKVISTNNPGGVLLVTCGIGAHSMLVSIYNPSINSSEAVLSRIGSYYAGWELIEKQLFIYFDRRCDSDQKDCIDFQKISVPWPKVTE